MQDPVIRETLIYQAQTAFIRLMREVDVLFDLTGFYLDRYPSDVYFQPGDILKTKELKVTVDNIAALSAQLGEVLKRWKYDEARILSKTGVEVSILNELWANVQALVYFLVSHEISLDPYDDDVARGCFNVLVKCNKLL